MKQTYTKPAPKNDDRVPFGFMLFVSTVAGALIWFAIIYGILRLFS